MQMQDRMVLQVNSVGIKVKCEQYGTCLTFNNRNKEVFTWDAEYELNKLMCDSSSVTQPNITAQFPGVLLQSDHNGPTAAVENTFIEDNSTAAGAAANAGIQHRAYDTEGYQPLTLNVDYNSSDDDENVYNNGNISGVNVLPVSSPSKMPVAESTQAIDSNDNATYVVQPRSETVEVDHIDKDYKQESGSNDDDSVNYDTRTRNRGSRRTRTKTIRFNISHDNINTYGYHKDIRMQTANVIKDTFLATDDITAMMEKYQYSYIMVVIMTQCSLKGV